jgi:uncharacterized protein DUF5916
VSLGGRGLRGQAPVPVRETAGPIRVDGIPDERAWRQADSITDFVQREPAEGRPPSERTVVRLLRGAAGLYVALWAYDRQPDAIRHAQLRRDADFDSDDSFAMLLSPLGDNRSGYLFEVNPNGAVSDAEVRSFEETNTEWDGVWDARARRGDSGWTAELLIPWQTLRYRAERDVWGANFRRRIRRDNQEVLWRAWLRTEGIVFLPKAGTLSGLSGLPPRALGEVRPYVLASGDLRHLEYGNSGADSVVALGGGRAKVGGDAKIALASALTLDLTANTDFAQVEADQQVINLTRFPLFFPEKRPFFLESGGIFDFGQEERTLVFYSRRIGLGPDGAAVPIAAGARLTGRLGRERVGLLATRTGGAERATDLVARLKHDVLDQGWIGAILTRQSTPGDSGPRLAGGLDATLPFVLQGQNLVLGAFAAETRQRRGAQGRSGWRVYLDYPNDAMDHFVGLARIAPEFDPPLGFVLEDDNTRFTGHFDFFPRPHRMGIRRLHFQALEWETIWRLDGTPSHASYSIVPLGAEFDNGDVLDLFLRREEDDPAQPFELFPGDTIAAGRYGWYRTELQFSSSAGRPVGFDLTASAGRFYTGRNARLEPTVTVRFAPHAILQLEGSVDAIRLPGRRIDARAGRLRFDYAASPRLGATLFLQEDNESRHLTVNARAHWIIRPGSDAYLVYNSAWPTGLRAGIPWRQPNRGTLIGKLSYYFRL